MGALDNKTYSWNSSTITFFANEQMDAFGKGTYKFIDELNVEATFGNRVHLIKFNKAYTKFKSTRKGDNDIVNGVLVENIHSSLKQTTDADNIAFITLTNDGYLDYTINCIESLKKINSNVNLKCYCVGEEGTNLLNNMGYSTELIPSLNKTLTGFQSFKNNGWADITYQKFDIIYKNLLTHKYVCFTDGDIVYENPDFFNYLLNNIKKKDFIIQSEGQNNDQGNQLCTGFIFIRSNEKTISLFNPVNVKKHKQKVGNKKWNDQFYINEFKHTVKYKLLPLELFPNGKYYYNNYRKIKPYMIHFNWVIGHTKKEKMIQYKKWYI